MVALAVTAAILGAIVAIYYHHLDLTLSHYDARAHLIVARRIFDSLTPGWRQIGAVWLPLPHLLNALPVQFDPFYRSGASAVMMSIAAFSVATAAIGWMVATITGSRGAAILGACVFALNPNVLYLQATPMTEPLLLGLLLPAVAMLMTWCSSDRPGPFLVGSVFALACLTRYEAWPVTAGGLAVAFWIRLQGGIPWRRALREVAAIGVLPALAILGFAFLSKALLGRWFVSSGFFVADNPDMGRPLAVAASLFRGLGQLTGQALLVVSIVGVCIMLVRMFWTRGRTSAGLPIVILAAAAVPFAAFLDGHPFRIRYMVPLIALVAVAAGVCAGGLSARWRSASMVTVLIAAAIGLRPLSATAPMVVEAQWDRPHAAGRAQVTACLAREYDDRLILASMNSLAHYMQELSAIGLRIRNFVYEENTPFWREALEEPGPDIGWILISENPDGRDALIGPARENSAMLRDFDRVCEGGRVALYRRRPPQSVELRSAR